MSSAVQDPIPIPGDRADWEAMMFGSGAVSCIRCGGACARKPSGVWTHFDPRDDRHMVLLPDGVDDAWNGRPGVRVSAAPPF